MRHTVRTVLKSISVWLDPKFRDLDARIASATVDIVLLKREGAASNSPPMRALQKQLQALQAERGVHYCTLLQNEQNPAKCALEVGGFCSTCVVE